MHRLAAYTLSVSFISDRNFIDLLSRNLSMDWQYTVYSLIPNRRHRSKDVHTAQKEHQLPCQRHKNLTWREKVRIVNRRIPFYSLNFAFFLRFETLDYCPILLAEFFHVKIWCVLMHQLRYASIRNIFNSRRLETFYLFDMARMLLERWSSVKLHLVNSLSS